MDDTIVKSEAVAYGAAETGLERRSSGYKSWKKKYRKMRITFEKHMHECEELHRQEERASATVKRLAIDIDRLLDLLLENNNSPQIPPNKRFDLSLPSGEPGAFALPIDTQEPIPDVKRLHDLIRDVPHSTFDSAPRDAPYMSDLLASLTSDAPDTRPAPFLTADDIDNYLYLVDAAIDDAAAACDAPRPRQLPTLAPLANPTRHAHSTLKNPTSVTNWLRKHAPKVFLQDGEHHDAADDADGPAQPSGRKARADRKPDRAIASLARRTKRSSVAASSRLGDKVADPDISMDDDADAAIAGPSSTSTPVVPRSKRKRDEDGGYRPGGSATRPSKKKRKSEAETTPAPRKPKATGKDS